MRLYFLIILMFASTLNAENIITDYRENNNIKEKIKIDQLSFKLNNPWGMTFIDNENLLVTEQNGNLFKININNEEKIKINHDLKISSYNQGGFLDVLYHNKKVYFTFTENLSDGKNTTSVAYGFLENKEIKNLKIIFRAYPSYNSSKHYGSRLVIKDNFLYVSIGDRGRSSNGQDYQKHPGSIIRLNLDGTIPKDNPKYNFNNKWLKEIFQIGVRNPQGMTVSPFDNNIYISNHGPKGGDFIGKVIEAGNYGWNEIGWGGTNYDSSIIGNGEPFNEKFDKPLLSWVPSIAPSGIIFYDKELFSNWKGDLLVSSLKFGRLIKVKFSNNKVQKIENIIKFRNGRVRDIEIDKEGKIYLIFDNINSPIIIISR